MIFPSIIEDETLYSLVSRIAILNGMTPFVIQCEISTFKNFRAADIDLDFDKFCHFTRRNYGKSLLDLHRFKSRCLFKKPIQNLIGLSNQNRNIWRWCEECASLELAKFGIAIWHIKHQDALTQVCINHRCCLQEVNIPYRNRQTHFYLPNNIGHKFKIPNKNIDLVKAYDLAIINDWLSKHEGNLDLLILKWIFNEQSKLHHFKKHFRDFCQSCPMDILMLEQAIKTKFSDTSFLSEYLPAFIYVYFGNLDRFSKYYLWVESLFTQLFEENFPRTERNFRELLIDYKKANPHAKRTEFWKTSPRAARWLLRYDKEWFDVNLPIDVFFETPYQMALKFDIN